MQFNISSGKALKAPKILIYGVEGIGKSTFASQFPNPLFIDTEGSTTYMDVKRLDPPPSSWQQLLDMIAWVRDTGTPGDTIVIDTLDWAERLCIDSVCSENDWTSIETPGYGRGYKQVYEKFTKLLDLLTEVANKGINVVCTAHAKMVKFEQPDEASSYDRWGLKLIDTRNTSIASVCKEWADAVLFANYKPIVERIEDGSKTTYKARGNKRVMYTTHDATYDAKNRWVLPPEVPFDFSSIAAFIPRPDVFGQQQPAPQQPTTPVTQQSSPAVQYSTPASNAAGATFEQASSKPWITQLRSLFQTSGIQESEFLYTVASEGYGTLNMPLEAYPDDTGQHFVAVFDKIREIILQNRASVPIK